MAHSYPKDRFDEVPEHLQRVGAHRTPPRRGRGWIGFGWAAVATLVLIGAGVIVLFAANGNITIKDPLASGTSSATPSASASAKHTPTPSPTPTPTVNPALNVAVLNATTEPGLAGATATKLKAAGWVNVTIADANVDNLTQTIVYYSDPANQLAAEALAQSLPGSTVTESQAYAETPANITVVLGSDTVK